MDERLAIRIAALDAAARVHAGRDAGREGHFKGTDDGVLQTMQKFERALLEVVE